MHQVDGLNSFLDDVLGRIFKKRTRTNSTEITDKWANAVQMEIIGVLTAAGIFARASGQADADASYASQLLEAIQTLVMRPSNSLIDAVGGDVYSDSTSGASDSYQLFKDAVAKSIVLPVTFSQDGGGVLESGNAYIVRSALNKLLHITLPWVAVNVTDAQGIHVRGAAGASLDPTYFPLVAGGMPSGTRVIVHSTPIIVGLPEGDAAGVATFLYTSGGSPMREIRIALGGPRSGTFYLKNCSITCPALVGAVPEG